MKTSSEGASGIARVAAAGGVVFVLIVAAAATGLLGVPHGEQEIVGGAGARASTSLGMAAWALGAGVTLFLLALMFLSALTGGISPRRVTSFTVRQYLRLTTTNAALVGGALTVQYRWRRLGLWAGGVAGMLMTWLFGTLQLSLAALFSGWFAGAAFAEFRVSRPVGDGPRRAVLAARSTGRFATVSNRVVVAVVAALLGLVLITAVVLGLGGGSADWLAPSAILVALWLALYVLYRRFVGRPAPAEPADVVSADDALRCQSLAVLSGSAVALSGFPAAQLVTGVLVEVGMPSGTAGRVGGVVLVLLALVGWWLASWSSSPRRRRADGTASGPLSGAEAGAGPAAGPGAALANPSQGLA